MAFTTESIYNSVRGALGLNDNINKGLSHNDNSAQEEVPEYDSKLKDDEITEVVREWKERWDNYSKTIESWQKDNERYWLGNQFNPIEQAGVTKRALVDNAIFEAVETFLPLATQTNPDPVVISADQQLGDLVRQALIYEADRQTLRMLLKPYVRNWALYFVAALKVYFDPTIKLNVTEVVPPKKLILDPDAWIDAKGVYHGEYIGEYKKVSVKQLKELFPEKAKSFDGKEDKTRVFMIEWTTKTDLFWTLDEGVEEMVVLGKTKNINWNWDGDIETPDPENPEEIQKTFIKGKNHFAEPGINYIFFSVFNLGKQPHDETGLIYQSIPMQDFSNERLLQIQQNVKRMNNGVALNGLFFTKEQASQALTQLERGGGLWVPNNEKMQGRLDEAFKFTNHPALPADVFQSYETGRERLVGIFGTAGSTPQGIAEQKDVRGKIMAQQMDSSRIGGGITTFLEQACDTWYNWQIQLMYVFWDEPHYIAAVGETGAQQIEQLHNQDLTSQIIVTVKEGSMVPKDPLTKRNEAVDLWSANAIDPISLYKALEFPDPYNQAKQLLQWQLITKGALPPTIMFPDFMSPEQQAAQMQAAIPGTQPGTGGPAVNGAPASQEVQNAPTGGLPEPTQQVSQQLMQSVPVQ